MQILALNFKNGPSAIPHPQYWVKYTSEVFKYRVHNICNGAPHVPQRPLWDFFLYLWYYVKKIYLNVSQHLYHISVRRLIICF